MEQKEESPEPFESTNNSELSHATGGAWTRTLSPERDFKSLVSASFRQSHFSFVVSFDFSLRERFFLCERKGFAFFDKIILPPFSLHVNHAKLFHLVVLDLRSVRDPGLPPGGWWGVDGGLIGTLIDWLGRWVISDFWRMFWSGWSDFDLQTDLIVSYRFCSTTQFLLSPAVLLLKFHRKWFWDLEWETDALRSIWSNRSIRKPYGWDLLCTPTRFRILKSLFQFFKDLVRTHPASQ